uniref:SET domain-containing protein n=1 Tax=Moniliophthora roreri TaxID=221103 RepID=A0A0W0G0Z7_MONRR
MSLLPGPSKATHPPVLSKTSIFEGRLNNLYWRFGNNNFSIHSHFNTYAHGIFPLASRLFNHSCTPNAAAKYIITPENSVKMEVIALRPISAGEEICLPYIDPALLQTRRTVFQMTYGFTCHCPSCVLLNTLGDVPEPPKEAEERKKVSKRLRDFMVSNGDANPIVSGVSALDPFPPELRCVLHESFLASLAEDFSNAAHDGPYDVAVEYGTTLTALYQLIYPPNYPQIGLHSLEMAKITWNQIVLSDSHDRAMKQQMWAYLSSAEKVLATLGKEGDQSNGPWNEIEMLTNILIEEGRDELRSRQSTRVYFSLALKLPNKASVMANSRQLNTGDTLADFQDRKNGWLDSSIRTYKMLYYVSPETILSPGVPSRIQCLSFRLSRMSFLHLPSIPGWQSHRRHSFSRLRSFHLSPNASPAVSSPTETLVSSSVPPSPIPDKVASSKANKTVDFDVPAELKPKKKNPRGLSITVLTRVDPDGLSSVPAIFWLGLAILVSLIFVLAMACTFSGVQNKEDHFKPILDDVAAANPGIVLLGENVDIDVDEPSITIRWSILACGEDYLLPGSAGVHGNAQCGLPIQPLNIYVDGDSTPTATYNPADIPFDRKSGVRRSIENLVQFDSDHVLDVHEDYLYPFDNYQLSSTLRATSLSNESVPIRKLATIAQTSSFLVQTTDVESYGTLMANSSTEIPSRDIDMRVKRPPSARGVALLLFAVSWFLTHISIGHVLMSRKTTDIRIILKNLISSGVILAGIPQLRSSMPDAPGFDGVLIDTIGYFPQMVITGLCVVLLLLIMVARELDEGADGGGITLLPTPPQTPTKSNRRSSYASNFKKIGSTLFPKSRPPPVPSPQSTQRECFVYDKHRIAKHLQGEFVFPPVQNPFREPPSPKQSANTAPLSPLHRRFKTELPKLQERSERGSLESIEWDFRDRNFESPVPPRFD